MDMRSAIGFGYISAILLSGIQKRDLEKRQAALEAAVNGLSLLKKRLSDEDSDVEPDEIEEVEQPGYVEMNGGSASQPSSTPDWQDSFQQNGVSPESVENAKHESVASVKAGPLLENNPKTDGHSELSLSRLAADPATSPPNPVPALPKQAQFVSPIPGLQLRHINGVNMIQIPAKPKGASSLFQIRANPRPSAAKGFFLRASAVSLGFPLELGAESLELHPHVIEHE